MDRIKQHVYNRKPKIILIWCITSLLLLAITWICFAPKLSSAAEANILIKEINYKDSTITLQVNGGNTQVYFSDSLKKTWELIPETVGSDKTVTLDISWIPITKNYIITLKGNRSSEITSVTIPKQITNFKASYNVMKGNVTFSNAGSNTIEWRKKDSTSWSIVDIDTLSTELSYLYTNGATLYFRLAPVNGTSSTSVGSRGSKEVVVQIPKKANAPSITLNGSKFCIPVKKGMAYRLLNSNGVASDWININASTNLYLKDIAPNVLYSGDTTNQQEVTLQFRMNATNSSPVSKITTLTIPVQEGAPSGDTSGISLSYTSSSSLALQVKAASSSIPFEYTIVKAEEELNYQSAKWSSIASSSPVSLRSSAAPNGSHIFIRKKSIEATDSSNGTLASVETDVSGNNGISYPQAPTANAATTLITTAGVCQAGKSASHLTFVLYSPTTTTVSTVNFRDAYGIHKGTVTCSSTVAVNSASTGSNDKYIITTKITSTSEIDTFTEELLYANITLANSDTIISTAASGVLLYLYPNTTVNNPVGDDYSEDFERIYLSTEVEDASSFKFKLDFGTEMVIDTSAINKYTTTPTAVSQIKYSGYTLIPGTDYTVEYGSATATITVHVKNFEDSTIITGMDQAIPLIINLNNNETLDNDIYLTLVSTAKIDKTPIAWSITEGSLKETKTSTITNTDGSTTTITEEVITYTITLTLFDPSYGVSVSNVTWGGTSVFGSAKVIDGKATIYLSNAKINKLSTDSTETQNIEISLSNGFVIKTGCKLTILNAMN